MKTLKLLAVLAATLITTSLHAQVPQILTPPQSQTIGAGSNFTVSVTATGVGISYFWYWYPDGGDTNLLDSTGTNSSYTLTGADVTNSGNYYVVVTNDSGSVTSSLAVISVLAPPVISVAPVGSTNAVASGSVTLSVTASGGGTLYYQWLQNGTNAAAIGTTPTFTISKTIASMANYSVVVSNLVGTTSSSAVPVYVVAVPAITNSFTNKYVLTGGSTKFTVACSNASISLLTYQWAKTNSAASSWDTYTNIPGATNSTLTLSSLAAEDSGGYQITVTNVAGSASSNCVLSVLGSVSISSQPLGTNVGAGTNVTTLAVTASGDGTYTYQWRKGGASISGANSASYTIPDLTTNGSGTYSVIVSNEVSGVTSSNAVVKIVNIPAFILQPTNKTIAVGSNYTFTSSCSNASSSLLSYQWLKDTVAITGATNATYTITNVALANAGVYNITVSNVAGTVTSTNATLTVITPVSITSQPLGTNVSVGTAISTLAVTAAGSGTIAYQWKIGGTNISGATSSSYPISSAQGSNSGTYTVLVTNEVSSVTSSNAIVTVVSTPVITNQPASKGVTVGGSVTMTVSVSNTTALTYQWFHVTNSSSTNALPSSNTNSLKLTGITTNNAGDYFVTVSNVAGVVTSDVATVTILNPPTIITDLLSTNVAATSNFTLTVEASGGLLSYNWYNGTNLLGTGTSDVVITNGSTIIANNMLTVTNAQTTESGSYCVVVSNSVGSVTSSIVDVLVVNPPSVVIEPKSRNLVTGTNYNLYIIMDDPDTSLLEYQWYYTNSVSGISIIDGAVSSNLYLVNVTSESSGGYFVVVSNIAGVVTSTVANLVVQAGPVITDQPQSTNLVAGGTLNLSVTATGDSLAYQWYKGTNAVSGATAALLSITGAAISDSGNYYVTVSNQIGALTSSTAAVYVVTTPVISGQPSGGSVVVGSDFNFGVTVDNAANQLLSYQWYNNVSNLISGATATNLYLSGVGQNDSGTYSVVVSNIAGVVTSSVATLTVITYPTILTQPASTNLATNGDIVLTVDATGGVIAYQWYKATATSTNRLTNASATTATLTIPNALPTNSGSYFVTLSNMMGKVTSDKAVVWVVAPPSIVTQPASQDVVEWSDVTFSVVMANPTTSLLSYQWYYQGEVIADETNSSLTLTEVDRYYQGDYYVVVTNLAGSATSANAALRVATPVTVVSGPISTNLAVGGTIDLSVYATGNLLSYTWYKNYTNVLGNTTSNLVITSATTADTATYTVLVTNIAGGYAYTSAVVYVVASPVITNSPATTNIAEGDDITFTVGVQNAATSLLSYQWYYTNATATNAISGGTNSSLDMQWVPTNSSGGYYAIVTNLAGKATSAVAVLTVETSPTITLQPLATNVGVGTNVTLSVEAAGGLLRYAWYKNSTNLVGTGTNLTGADTSTLLITGPTTNDTGIYAVVITNDVGAVTSSNVVVNVVKPPAITTDLPSASTYVADGDACNLSIAMTDAATSLLNYQWYYNTNVLIDGETSTNLQFVVGKSDAGKYIVVITNVAGAITSAEATLVIETAVSITNQPVGASVGVGENVTNWVGAAGDNLSYQWYKDGSAVSGATTYSNYLGNIQIADMGNYYVVVTNEVSTNISDTVKVRVVQVPTISVNLTLTNYVITGHDYSATITVANPDDLVSYIWKYNGSEGAPTASPTKVLSGTSDLTAAATNTLSVTASNLAGKVESITNYVCVEDAPSITTDLISSTNLAKGSNFSLSITAGGSFLHYQWYRNTHAVGIDSNVMTITNASVTDSGSYSVVITNEVGSITNATFTEVLVVAPPVIMASPVGGAILVGTNFSFAITMRSPTNSLLNYQWYYGTNNSTATNAIANGTGNSFSSTLFAGSTTSNLTLTTVATNDSGFYSVVITNLAGAITSAPVELKVQYIPVITNNLTNIDIPVSSNLVFAAGVTNEPLYYQWYFNSNLLAVASTNTLVVSNAQTTDSGYYYAIVTNSVGAVTTAVARARVVASPTILTQPLSKAMQVGKAYTLTVIASNAENSLLSYEWLCAETNTYTGTNVSYASNSNKLVMSNLQTSDSGFYYVVVSNMAGVVTSSIAWVRVQNEPEITVQPANTVVGLSNQLDLSVTATGEGIGYQWRKNKNNILNATSDHLIITNVSTSDAGTYSVYITNGIGNVLSANAIVKVVTIPVITRQPLSRSIVSNITTTVSVTVSSASSQYLSYQWWTNSSIGSGTTNAYLLPNATNSAVTLSHAVPAQSADYYVVVSNAAGVVTSDVASVNIQAAPVILQQPVATNIVVGTNLDLSVTASGDNLYYIWLLNGKVISNYVSSATYSVSTAGTNDSGFYSVIVSNAVGKVYSSAVAVYVVAPPAIQTQPVSNVVVAVGKNYSFSVVASNAATSLLSYQWYCDETNAVSSTVLGANSSKLTLKSLNVTNSGAYTVVITNIAGSVTSSVANLVVLAKPGIVTSPQNTNVGVGQPLTLHVEATGGLLSYIWRKGTTLLAGYDSDTLTITNVDASDVGKYSVIVSNQVGKLTSAAANVQVIALPGIKTQPKDTSVAVGSNTLFSVVVTNPASAFLSYQWYCTTNGDTNVFTLDSTNSTYSFKGTQMTNAGSYWVVVSSLAGSVTSSLATLSVLDYPVFTDQPTSTNVALGSTLTLGAYASGSGLNYRWTVGNKTITQKNVSGLTTSNLVFTSIGASNAGTYNLIVSNNVGKVTSSNIVVKVVYPPLITKQPASGYVIVGNSYTFSVTVSNTAAAYVTYQWYTNGDIVTGGTSNSLKLVNVQTNGPTNAFVVVSNVSLVVTSATATLTALQKPTFVLQALPSYTVAVGTNLVLTNWATPADQLAYVWKVGSSVIKWANTNAITLTNAQTKNSGTYTLTISNGVGKVVSSNFVVKVVAAPAFSKQPSGKALTVGSSYTLSATLSNASTSLLTYQWYQSNSASGFQVVSGATASSYKIVRATTNDSGIYQLVVTNIAGVATSLDCTIDIQQAPSITFHPFSTNLAVSNTLTLGVVANGTSLSYIWKKDKTYLTNFTGSTLEITNATTSDSGKYSVIVSNSVGKVTSSNAVVWVVASPMITNQPSGGAIGLGSNFIFNVSMDSPTTSLLKYRWYQDGVPIDDGNTNKYTVKGAQYADAGVYTLVVTNLAGAVTSTPVSLIVQQKPSIVTQPARLSAVTNGDSLSLSVVAAGDSLSYQWRVKHGTTTTNIDGATDSTLTLSNVSTSDAGIYSVVINNLVGTVTSSSATVRIYYFNGTKWVEKLPDGTTLGDDDDSDTVPNELAAAAGNYTGLFYRTDVLDKDSAGLLMVTITTNLTYSGKIQISSESIAISGQLTANGYATTVIAHNGGDVTVNFAMDVAAHQLNGTVSGTDWTSKLTADLADYATGTAGSYKIEFPGLDITGLVTVAESGDLLFIGQTVEGISITQSVQTSQEGYWPLFIQVNSGKDGELIGWIQFLNGTPAGTVSWLKPDGSESTSTVTAASKP